MINAPAARGNARATINGMPHCEWRGFRVNILNQIAKLSDSAAGTSSPAAGVTAPFELLAGDPAHAVVQDPSLQSTFDPSSSIRAVINPSSINPQVQEGDER